jgi:hypothetical protein
MSCKTGDITNCLSDCENCSVPTMDNLSQRNEQCQNVCSSTLNHGFATIKPICHCCPRKHIIPCENGTDFERKKCYLEQGYQYFEDECVTSPESLSCEEAIASSNGGYYSEPYEEIQNNKKYNSSFSSQQLQPPLNKNQKGQFDKYTGIRDINVNVVPSYDTLNRSTGGELNGTVLGGLHINDQQYMGCDYTFPYNNEINLLEETPWQGQNHNSYKMKNGGYLKYDKITDNIILISMNPRQGSDKIADMGILRTPSIDPKFVGEILTNNNLKVSIDKSLNYTNFDETDSLLESKLDNNVINVSKNNLNIVFDFFTCQYGTLRIKDKDFKAGVHKYYIFGLGPITTNTEDNFSLNWADYKRRCNQGFGTMQAFGIYGSHWPIMYVLRVNQNTGEQKCFMVYFDHFRKTEYFFDNLQSDGIIKIRTREPEFRFYVSVEDTILNLRKQYMKITGSPQPPVQKAMGLWIQKFGYEKWEDLEADIDLVRNKNFPVDGFIFDLYWFGHIFPTTIELNENSYDMNFCHQKKPYETANELGKFKWSEKNFPEHKKYLNELMQKYNYGNTLIEEPYISADADDFSFMYTNNMIARLKNGSWAQPEGVWNNWVGNHAAMPDYTNPNTSKHWFNTRILPNMTDGTFFWWNDLSEPEVYNENALYLGIGQVNNNDKMLHEMHQAPDVLNFNQLLWNQGIANEYNKQLNKRYNVLCRAGTCGIQRYGAFMWPGDSFPYLVQLNACTNSLSNLSLSGLDFSATDAGGFASPITDNDERQKLYSMWFANSAATNFTLKPHKYVHPDQTTASPTEWGSVDDNFFITLERYMLSPYYYSSAMDISSFGENQGFPFTTTLFFKYQFDPKLLYEALDDKKNSLMQFVGPNLVYAMLYKYEETSRSIYFPVNTKWYDYRNNVWFDGGQKYTVKFKTKNICPLFIKNNSVLITRDTSNPVNMRYNDIINTYMVYIYSYEGNDADSFTLYIDDGISMNKNQTKIKLSMKNGVVMIKSNSLTLPTFEFFLIDKNNQRKKLNNVKNEFLDDSHSFEIKNQSLDTNGYIICENYTDDPKKNNLMYILVILATTTLGFILGKLNCGNNSHNILKFASIGMIIGLIVAVYLITK